MKILLALSIFTFHKVSCQRTLFKGRRLVIRRKQGSGPGGNSREPHVLNFLSLRGSLPHQATPHPYRSLELILSVQLLICVESPKRARYVSHGIKLCPMKNILLLSNKTAISPLDCEHRHQNACEMKNTYLLSNKTAISPLDCEHRNHSPSP